MRPIPVKRTAKASDSDGSATLAKLATESRDAVMDDRDATIVQLQAQAQRHEAVFNAIAQGVCCFDAEDRVILSNRRFAEIYRLAPEQIYPGITLREVIELRIAAGTWAVAADDYLSFCVANHFSSDSIVWMTELPDGRLIQMRRQPMPGGGVLSPMRTLPNSRPRAPQQMSACRCKP